MNRPPRWTDDDSLRAARWRLRERDLILPRRPLLMGILNVTPDSFSDGGNYLAQQAAVEQGMRLASEGADLIDIGGESTRPYSTPVSEQEELSRVLPVVESLAGKLTIPLSIDTSKARVAEACVQAGAEIINDVTGLQGDPRMIDAAVSTGAGVCVMHMQGTPQVMQDSPTYQDVVEDVFDYLRERRDALEEAGIAPDKIALDPGVGFGKTHQHNLALLANCERFHELGRPLLLGPSRKGFIGKLLQDKQAPRVFGTIGVALSLASQGVQVLRVHDVGAVREALLLFDSCGGIDGLPASID
ncbi:MAG: dihydropteroate synthase [Planctomycetales bacterium]